MRESSDGHREPLVGGCDPAFAESKVNAFVLVDRRLRQVTISSRKDLDGIKPIWIDLLNSTKSERSYIGLHFRLSMPNPREATDLEVSPRFLMKENGDIYLRSIFCWTARATPGAFQFLLLCIAGFCLRSEMKSFQFFACSASEPKRFDKINFLMNATIGFINILVGMGGMSEFSMMTQAIPWPVAYGAFLAASVLVGGATYAALNYFEGYRAKARSA